MVWWLLCSLVCCCMLLCLCELFDELVVCECGVFGCVVVDCMFVVWLDFECCVVGCCCIEKWLLIVELD